MTSHTAHRRTTRYPRLLAVASALLASLLLNSQALAQGERRDDGRHERWEQRSDPEKRLEHRVAFLTEELRLSDQQQGQVRQILTQQRGQMRALWEKARKEDGASREELRSERRAIHERTAQQIEKLLTAEQRATYRELREAHRKEHTGPGHRHRRGDGSRAGSV